MQYQLHSLPILTVVLHIFPHPHPLNLLGQPADSAVVWVRKSFQASFFFLEVVSGGIVPPLSHRNFFFCDNPHCFPTKTSMRNGNQKNCS